MTKEQESMVLNNTKLVTHIIRKYVRPHPNKFEDYYQVGCVGLIKSVLSFKPELGYKFSTYAASMIYGEARRYKRDEDSPYGIRIPRTLKDRCFKLLAEDPELDKLTMTSEEYAGCQILLGNVSSLDYTIESEKDRDSADLYDVVKDEASNDPFITLEIEDAIESFFEIHQGESGCDLAEEFFYDVLVVGRSGSATQQEYANKYDLSQAQVSRILSTYTKKFKEYWNRD